MKSRSGNRLGHLPPRTLALAAVAALFALPVFAQFGGWGRSGEIWVDPSVKLTREIPGRTVEIPMWPNPVGFESDTFTFARLRYEKSGMPGARGGWTTDLPDADLNLSYRLQQMTSMRTDPNGRVVRASDPELFNYPFLYAAAPGAIGLTSSDIENLRKYLLGGGSMIMTDFWGDQEVWNMEELFRRILPGHKFVELQLDHELYRSVFQIVEKGQVPQSERGKALEYNPNGPTWEQRSGSDTRQVNHRALFDEKGRLMVLGIHNSDHSDGWEREGESDYYFHRFSEQIAYPLAINALVYMMTH
jgi:hypothetical protein